MSIEWQQEMFDGTYETFEMLRRPDTIAVIAIDDNGEIIACHEEQPGGVVRKNHIPAGRVDHRTRRYWQQPNENVEEEVGYRFKNWKLFQVHQPLSKLEWFIQHLWRGVKMAKPVHHDAGEKNNEGRADLQNRFVTITSTGRRCLVSFRRLMNY